MKVVDIKGNNPGSDGKMELLSKPVRVNDFKSAKRLLSKLIYEFQKGTIKSREAKDLTYMLISYVQICKDMELEARLEELERQITDK